MFALEKQVVNTLVSKMIISDELFASWDQPTGSIVMVSLSLGLALSLGLRSWSWDQPTGSMKKKICMFFCLIFFFRPGTNPQAAWSW
jgi:hypothetical protein